MAKALLIFLFIFLLSFFCYVIALDLGLPKYAYYNTCDRERIVYKTKYGVISNGNEYYKDSHCEWLIKAPNESYAITLSFNKMDTECSYDHIFIYDGESYKSPILGSFSGNTTPSSVTALHGSMLVLLYSDTNYVRTGFEAVFHVTDCPANCTNNGICQNYKCLCQPLWSGSACDINLCPNDCGNFVGHGQCDLNGTYPARCQCKSGYAGMDCSLPDSNKNSGNSWHLLSVSGIGPRAGSVGVYIEKTDSFYVFGGYTFRKVLGDTLVYSFAKNEWEMFEPEISPSPRYGHTAVTYLDNICVFGGELQNGSLSNDLWIFNIFSSNWTLIEVESSLIPPPMAKHSATLVETHWMYIIGGSLSDGTMSSKMYRINLLHKKWEIVESYGNKQANHRLVGHSAVYYEPIKTIFVFGGITAEYSHVSKLSNVMHAFHIEKKYWVKINYNKRNVFSPLERAFHSAAIIGDYMVIYGGYTHRHVDAEICYDNETHLYHLQCHKWVDFSTLKGDIIGLRNPIRQGVFSHAMDVRRGHTLLIFGGFSGNMRSEFLAYVMPSVIVSDQPSLNKCSKHKRSESCLSNLACGWCVENEVCIERKDSKNCNKFSAEICPGFCSVLTDCQSCLLWGHSLIHNDISDRQEDLTSFSCAWCVQDLKCHALNDGDTNCLSANISLATHVSSNRLWGAKGRDVLNLNDCYTKVTHPGLISVQYRYPVNWSQPDDVSYLLQASEDLYFRSEIQRNDSSHGAEENVVKFIGFLHPMNAKPLSERVKNLKLAICSAGSSAILKLSNDSSPDHLESVASHGSRTSYDCLEAQRARGSHLFPHSNGGEKYLFDFTVKIPMSYNETSKVQLKWNAFSVELEVIQHKYLELYKNGSCQSLTNCLSCLTDSLCGWCESSGTCHLRSNFSVSCLNSDGNSFLITQPNSCTICSDYIYCEDCTQLSNCEWLIEAAICVRKGRYKIVVKEPAHCPTPCHLRESCGSCLGDPGVCAWCEETRTCFPFSIYTSLYSFGKCRDWVDENRVENGDPKLLCRNCSRHNNCSTCLKDLTCGWCSYAKYPLDGLCIEGDFSGSYLGSCPALLKNETEPSDSQWLYGNCPDLDECYWGLDNCHKNASCKNTPESYDCECNIGFVGDGINCIRSCSVRCVHGYCSEDPYYKCICDLGWTGEDCNVNCGCNNHSTCQYGLGICDECHFWTEGKFCEKCRSGSFGYGDDSKGCQKCDCNGHGDPEKGYCDIVNGTCFCLNNTIGTNCEKCIDGYYGNPSNNGDCFEVCSPRKVITNATGGKFGSPSGSYQSQDCLWLLTVHPVLDMQSLLGPMESTDYHLQLNINPDMHVPCPHNHIYVYDGLPNFVASGHPNVLLGTFCGSNVSNPYIVTAVSGYLTVHFKRDFYNYGFNASYTRLMKEPIEEITEYCLENVTLDDNVTVCLRNYCPKDCYRFLNQGNCDKEYRVCLCEKGFGGDDCSVKLTSHNLVWHTLYNYKSTTLNGSSTHLPSGRMGHAMLSVKNKMSGTEDLWLFGGYSRALGYLDDLYLYDTSSNKWVQIIVDNNPAPRLFHGATTLNGSLYIFGGMDDKAVFNDFWEFDTLEQKWIQLPDIQLSSGVITLAGSTLTAVNDHTLLLIGGYSPEYGLLENIMEYDLEKNIWMILNTTGAVPVGLYGHSSVFHESTQSIYIYGGILYDTESVSPSNRLYSFHYPSAQWFQLPSEVNSFKVNSFRPRPLPRYYHASVVTEDYLIIIGGRSPRTLKDSHPFAYVISCNLWIPLKDAAIQVVGKWPKPIVGASMTIANGEIYYFGGSDGQLLKLSLPSDFCELFSWNRIGCLQQTGCAFCDLNESGINQTVCYSQKDYAKSRCYNTEAKQVFTVLCNDEWLEKRDCKQYKSCSECVTSWPYHPQAKQMCRWCSNCRVGTCAPIDSKCNDLNDCSIQKDVINDPSLCPVRDCAASDCEKCGALGRCIWTRQVIRSGGYSHTLNKNPIYNWICVLKEIVSAPSFPVQSMPPLECPTKCYQQENCTSCLTSVGADGGWHQCVWSETKKLCMAPTFELLSCEDGSCGPILFGNKSICPAPCWQHFQASHCLSQSSCGWCAFSGPQVDGRGLCMNGGIMGPTGGICRENQVVLFGLPLPIETLRWYQLSQGAPVWTYLTKPPENECKNGHHNCDDAHEECVDTLEAFECRCKSGYKMIGNHCTPICNQGCSNGTCVQPDVCKCHFGFVGQNCSTTCKCNGHSDCPSVEKLDVCLECQNNTMGTHCEKCKPLFVGNPVNGGKCVSCYDHCYTHSSICISSDLVNGTYAQIQNQTFVDELVEKMTEGPLDDAVCIDCKNHTEGKRCDQCILGFFKSGEKIEDGCRQCECHGHGDMCNPLNGENCNCQNNTENDRQCSQKNMKNIMQITPCWQLQCSKCKDNFIGTPSHGHQCYRHMYIDKDYCFNPGTIDECNRNPSPLLLGRTGFFAVQPRYMNVNIRIVIDVTKGAVDVFMSAKDDAFIVEVDKETSQHHIFIDEKYGLDSKNYDFIYSQNVIKIKRSIEDSSKESFNFTDVLNAETLLPTVINAQGLITFHEVKNCADFLLVRNLQNRLVITVPQHIHDLRQTRFYIILRGAGEETFGNMFFRQDQTRIDLFVFFSVFFSCFFLFLAVCVVVWKVKQAFDIRRQRRLHAAEMKHMASRPFGRMITVVEQETEDCDLLLYSPNYRKKLKNMKTHGRDSPRQAEEKSGIRPIAVEPLSDGYGAIATILVQLPGGAKSLVRMSLASSLITARSSPYHLGFNLRAAMRRRASHANA